MGCCETKEDQSRINLNENRDLCIAYVRKSEIKDMLEKNKRRKGDDKVIRNLMKEFDDGIDLTLLL